MIASPSTQASGDNTQSADDTIRAMVVDDALVIRGMLTRFLEETGDISVVASVGDGERALSALDRHDVDVVILDIEMPRMDGLEALPQIIKKVPGIQVLMASTLTMRNAEISLKAMSLGAADYVPKPSTGELRSRDDFKRELIEKVRTLGRIGRRRRLRRAEMRKETAAPGTSAAARVRKDEAAPAGIPREKRGGEGTTLRALPNVKPDVIVVGSSTGGPQALFQVMKDIPESVKQPILITQHMPPTFTTILAEHVAKASGRPTVEAKDGDLIEPGHIYVAPGDYHMIITAQGAGKRIKLTQDPPENFCRPAVDPMLRSAVDCYGKNILAVILTGMGADGCKGCQSVVDTGGAVIAQDEETSVVWGMPGAVAGAGICSAVLPVQEIGTKIGKIAQGGSA